MTNTLWRRRGVYKTLHVLSMLLLIFNMSALGVFFVAESANATDTVKKENPITVKAYKVVCDSEEDLPNWMGAAGLPSETYFTDYSERISPSAIEDFLADRQGRCHLESGWKFQWSNTGEPNPGDNMGEYISDKWTTVGPTGADGAVSFVVDSRNQVRVREVWQEGYQEFAGISASGNVSAEMACGSDVHYYDNFDYVDTKSGVDDYYCVAFNVMEKKPSSTATVNVQKLISGTSQDGWEFEVNGQDIATATASSVVGGFAPITVSFDCDNASLNVLEHQQADYSLATATCYKTDDGTYVVGSSDTGKNGVFNITVKDGDQVNCIFENETVKKETKGSINVCKYQDVELIGQKDASDQPLGGWAVRAVLNDNTVKHGTTTLDNGGCYTFEDLDLGTWAVLEDYPDNTWGQTYPAAQLSIDPNEQYKHVVVLSESTTSAEVYFLNKKTETPQTGAVKVCKYYDADGVYAAENTDESAATDPWTFTITDGSGATTSLVSSAENNCVIFDNLAYGNYQIEEAAQAGWTRIFPAAPLSVTVDSTSTDEYKFVNYKQPITGTGSIQGCKWNDENGNGIWEGPNNPIGNYATSSYETEKLAGWQIVLEGPVKATTTTGENGCYLFNNLPDGAYTVSESGKIGWEQTYPNASTSGAVLSDSQYTYSINVSTSAPYMYNDFGNHLLPGPICGNDIKETGEQCDDGNLANGDGCSAQCTIEAKQPECGNNIIESGEQCDGTDTPAGRTCLSNCTLASQGGGGLLIPTNRGGGTSGQTSGEPPVVAGEEGAPALTIDKSVNQTFANPGDKGVEYTIVVANNGNLTAFTVVLADNLPDVLTYSDDGSIERSWQLGDIAPGTSQTITVKVNVSKDAQPGKVANLATASAANNGEVSDSAELEIREITVLAETGFSLGEFIVLLFTAACAAGTAFVLKRQTA